MKTLDELKSIIKGRSKRKLFIAGAEDPVILRALSHAGEFENIVPIFMGNSFEIKGIINVENMNFSEHEILDFDKVEDMVAYVSDIFYREGNCVLMKGRASTASLMREVIKKENRLIGENLLSHVAIMESPFYHKLFCVTDAAMNISPNVQQKISIINNAVNVMHKLGVDCPKVACLAAIEKVNPKIQSTTDARDLTDIYRKEGKTDCIVYGPLAMDNALSKEAAEFKDIDNEVAGDADIFLVPEINSGNILYKSLNYLSELVCASIMTGAKIPIALTSRTDKLENKYYSALLACSI